MDDPTALPSLARNGARFEYLQRCLAGAILRQVRDDIARAELAPKQMKDLAMTVTFNVFAILDASAVIEDEKGQVIPVLTFLKDCDEPQTLILDLAGTGSYLHEILVDVADEVFPDAESD